MSTQQIIERAQALAADPQQEKTEPKRSGAWAELEQFVDTNSGFGVVIRERIRGRPAYSYSIVYFDDRGPNRYLPYPCAQAERPPEEIIYLLVKRACEYIEKLRTERGENRKERRRGKKKPDKRRDKRRGRREEGRK